MAENPHLRAKAERIAKNARIMAEAEGFTVPRQEDLVTEVITWLAVQSAAALEDATRGAK